ncbi:hypothetical protein BDV29DRAFT_181004 [Aspergillus leporis]|jgi:hypothetical protein|uniref:Uncharacterized protein n=1 Tax=Aspergillus leporis TaxID=41062 RepID=A0A5N5WRJ0_9EURO|nr:hypothetical protein BDV29DRAFT_181004 [Aspergillus leporis]
MLQVVHANLRKTREVQLSFLNDRMLTTYDLLMVSEPYIIYTENQRSTHTHNKWRVILPETEPQDEEATARTRSMIWVKKEKRTYSRSRQGQQTSRPSHSLNKTAGFWP